MRREMPVHVNHVLQVPELPESVTYESRIRFNTSNHSNHSPVSLYSLTNNRRSMPTSIFK